MTDESNPNRRHLIGAAALGAGALVAGSAAAQVGGRTAKSLNNAKSVMPDGKLLNRSEILAKLGLNPDTVSDKWLTIGCGVNAAALRPGDLQALVRSRKLSVDQLDAATRATLR